MRTYVPQRHTLPAMAASMSAAVGTDRARMIPAPVRVRTRAARSGDVQMQLATHEGPLALDALEMGIWTRDHAGQAVTGLTHHSDKGVQYVAIRYTERLAEAGAAASVGSTGDSYDNALAEAFNSLFKAELVRNRGPWKNIDDLEIAVAEWVDWYNHRRPHEYCDDLTPVQAEQAHYAHHQAPETAGVSN